MSSVGQQGMGQQGSAGDRVPYYRQAQPKLLALIGLAWLG